jgi:TonB family protein
VGGGEGVVDVLGGVGAGGIGDLNTALSAGGLTVASSRGQRTVAGRGTGRAAGAGGIDELVSGVAAGQSKSLGRSGAIKIAGPAEIVGQARGAANRNPDAISEVVNSKQEAVNFCYQQEVRINPDLKGDVAVTFTIKANGKVDNPRIKSSTLNNAKVERCIIDRVRRWEFSPIDPKQGDVTITQKYIFG